MKERSNEEWLEDLQGNGMHQREALAELRDYLLRACLVYLRRHRSDLTHFTYGDIRQLAEDITQDAIVSIQNNLDSFRYESKFTTWAYRFVINRAISELRRVHYRTRSLEQLPPQDEGELISLSGRSALDPRQEVERRNMIQLLNEIIDTELTDLQRQAVYAVYIQGQAMEYVAQQLGTNRNAIYKLLHDARKKLKAHLQAIYPNMNEILALFEG